MTLNPALTGLYEGRYRVSMIYRDQWRQTLENPYNTFSGAADFRYFVNGKKRAYKDAFGVGVLFYSDRVAELNYSTNQIMFSTAFHKSLTKDNSQTLSLGVQFGIAQRNVSYDQLTFEDEFNGTTGFEEGLTGEVFPENNFAFGDYQVGLNYSYAPKKGFAVYAGAALHHITEPEQSFYFESTREEDVRVTNTLFRKYSGYVNFRLPIGRDIQLSPRALVYSQGPHLAMVTGSNIRFLVNDRNGAAIHLGGWVRPVQNEDSFSMDSAIAFFGLEYNNFLLGLSYDIGLNQLNTDRRHQGAFELSVAYLGQSDDDEAVPCPKF
jgi:type IX secretion system PorP/SprF family membrane protein